MNKTALLCAGGGMRGIYGCGILDVFISNDIVFDYCVAVSSGSANAASFLAGQRERNYRFYTVHAKDKRYLGLYNYMKTGSFFGLEYIYDTLTNIVDPIDYDALEKCPTEFIVVATDVKTGKPKYFSKDDISKGDYRVFMASSAVPAFCKPIEIDSTLYFDGGISDPLPVQKCLDAGCDKIIAIIPRSIDSPKSPENFHSLYKNVLKEYPESVKCIETRHLVYNESVKQLKKLEKEGKAIIMTPSKKVRISMFSQNDASLNKLYTDGVFDAWQNIIKIKKFLYDEKAADAI